MNITWDQFEHQTAGGEQSPDAQLYQMDIDRLRLVNSRRVQISYVANQQAFLMFLFFISVATSALQTFLKFVLLIPLHVGYSPWNLLYPTSAVMDGDELWVARVPNYRDDVLVQGHRYEYIFSSRLGLFIGVEN